MFRDPIPTPIHGTPGPIRHFYLDFINEIPSSLGLPCKYMAATGDLEDWG